MSNLHNNVLKILKEIKDSNFRLYLDSESDLKLDTYKGQLGYELKDEILQHKEELIHFLNKNKGYVEINRSNNKPFYPLSSSQLRLYFMYEFDKTSLAYNMPQAIELEGEINIKKLKEVLESLISYHSILRTSFNIIDGEVVQKIHDNLDFNLEYYEDISSGVPLIIEKFIRPFDLSKPCLFRVGLIELPVNSQILMFDMHHIISDGVSQNILLKDFMSLYNGETLQNQRIRYCDYVEWQLSSEQKENLKFQREYWLKEYGGDINSLDLPLDYRRPLRKNHKGSAITFSISKNQTSRLRELTKETGATMFMLVLSVFNVLLSKLCSQEDIVVGTPISGREHPDLESLMGMFVNMLPLRNYVTGEISFLEFLRTLKGKVLTSFENQSFLYEELVEDLGLSRTSNRNPLFDVVLAFHNFEQSNLEIPNLKFKRFDTGHEFSKFDMMLVAMEGEDHLGFRLEYSNELFKEKTIERFAKYFQKIITIITKNPEIKIQKINILSKQEVSWLQNRFDNIDINYPIHETIINLFEKQVARSPEKTCLVFENESLTYQEVNERANRLGLCLRKQGVKRDQIIGLLMERSINLVVGMLGILKSGGAYLPLDVDSPGDRLSYILEDSGANLLLTQNQYSISIKYDIRTVFIEDVEEALLEKENLKKINRPSDLCYIIYTSGTTGTPKGVMIEHGNVVRLFFNEQAKFDFTEKDVWTMFHNHTFDFSVWEIYGALLFGGKLIIIPKMLARDPMRYLALLKEMQVTVLNQTPSAFYNLIEADKKSSINSLDLRMVIFGGEALSPIKLNSWKKKYPVVKLVNMFGITETTVHVTYREITEDDIENDLRIIGHPLPTLSIYLLDKYGQLVPTGAKGEICVGGKGVSRGYLNRKKLTSQKFIKNPYLKKDRLYLSGDIARILSNGELEYLGRIDDQIKLRGFRIELGEIEGQLSRNNKILECTVTVETKEDEKFLVAYYVSKKAISQSDLSNYLSNRLPSYMIPSFFVYLKKIPLTQNGKINRAALPHAKVNLNHVYLPPSNHVQKRLVEIWEDILSIENIGVNHNFFLIGGDSIKAIKLVYKINEEFDSSISLANLYGHPTVESISSFLESVELIKNKKGSLYYKVESEVNAFERKYLKKNNVHDLYESALPMSGIEKGMIFHTMTKKDEEDNYHNILYHEQNVYPIKEENFDFNLFKKSINLLINVHSDLRKIYDIDGSTHIILKEIEPELNYLDLSDLPRIEQEKMYVEKIKEERLKASGYDKLILWRMNILKINNVFHYLIFDFHHSLFDGWSLHSFLKQLNNTYFKLKANSNLKLEPFKCDYRDHIISELMESRRKSTIAYWKNELSEYKRLQLTKTGAVHKYVTKRYDLGSELRNEITTLAATLDISLKDICFAAYLYTMKMFSGSNELVVGVTTNTRPIVEDGEKMLGCFLNQVPFKVDISDLGSWQEFIIMVTDKIRKQKEHERMPFYRILEVVGERTQNGINPIFDVAFNFIDFWIINEMLSEKVENHAEENLDFWHDDISVNQNTLFDFHISITNGAFSAATVYSTTVMSDELSEKFLLYFKNVLSRFKELKESTGVDKIMPNEEKELLLNNFNDTSAYYPKDKTVIDIFELQVAKTPLKTALLFGAQKMSYSEFDDKVNWLSQYLITNGVKPGDIIGVLCNRSFELMISLFSILKCGAVYLPLDPVNPPERINYMIADSGVKIVLSNFDFSDELGLTIELLDLNVIWNLPVGGLKISNLSTPSGLAYIIYTSGSTGKPKGVMVEHRALMNRIYWMGKRYPIDEKDVLIQKTAIAFDVSLSELLWWSQYGASLYLLGQGDEKEPAKLCEVIENHSVSTIHFVPSMLQVFLEYVEDSQSQSRLSSLLQVFASGEELLASQVNKFNKLLLNNGTRLTNLYGPTEATIEVSYYDCCDKGEYDTIPIGKPISNISLYILGKNETILPIGVAGELYIGGDGLAKGYINNKPLTHKKFVDNPFNPGDRIYMSGDIARWLTDGNIEFLGRIDDQVKISGFRIELGEIQNQLLNHPGITESIVLANRSDSDYYLIGYYVSEAELGYAELQDYLRKALPDYMVPRQYVHLDKLPLTPNGKVDKKSLPLPGAIVEEFVPPSNELEAQLVTIWSEVLGLEKGTISVNSNFFDLGGHSLKALVLLNKMNKVFDIAISFQIFFKIPNITEIASFIMSLAEDVNSDKHVDMEEFNF
ncbi:amino acid adenylation domain-containing protein [Maribacter sp. 2307UL18-2]|uniref:amino acid adenylation domain-containing protein n=1 Tax=Maribacter sp. 2307UL18-2 TaxID=3386274 RepID=UPI0039BC8B5E